MVKAIDYFDESAVALLDNLHLWRLRAIERVELSGAFWSQREREIHIQPFKDVTTRRTPEEKFLRRALFSLDTMTRDRIQLVLPITELPDIPILDLSITVAGSHVHRVSRDESARIQASYVMHLADRAGLLYPSCPIFLRDFLAFIFYSPSHPYRKIYNRRRLCNRFTPDAWVDIPLAYLDSEGTFNLGPFYLKWQKCVDRISELAEGYVLRDPLSAAQYPLISLPYFIKEMESRRSVDKRTRVPGVDDITDLLEYLKGMLNAAHAKAGEDGDERARKFISTYFAYGYRWMAFSRCTVPLHESFTISVTEKRAIYFTPHTHKRWLSPLEQIRKEAVQMVAFGDAETNHVNIRVSDPAVRMSRSPKILDELGNPLKKDDRCRLDDEKGTFEFYLRQDSQRGLGRYDRIYIKCPLHLARVLSGMLWLTIGVTGLAFILLLNRGISTPLWDNKGDAIANGLTAKEATLVLVPVAFAAALLLVKDNSTLSSWLRRLRQTVLLIELSVLLVTAFMLLWIHHVKVG
ncbi:hypothetical protein [Streptomyces asiaticus]